MTDPATIAALATIAVGLLGCAVALWRLALRRDNPAAHGDISWIRSELVLIRTDIHRLEDKIDRHIERPVAQ